MRNAGAARSAAGIRLPPRTRTGSLAKRGRRPDVCGRACLRWPRTGATGAEMPALRRLMRAVIAAHLDGVELRAWKLLERSHAQSAARRSGARTHERLSTLPRTMWTKSRSIGLRSAPSSVVSKPAPAAALRRRARLHRKTRTRRAGGAGARPAAPIGAADVRFVHTSASSSLANKPRKARKRIGRHQSRPARGVVEQRHDRGSSTLAAVGRHDASRRTKRAEHALDSLEGRRLHQGVAKPAARSCAMMSTSSSALVAIAGVCDSARRSAQQVRRHPDRACVDRAAADRMFAVLAPRRAQRVPTASRHRRSRKFACQRAAEAAG